MAGLMEISSRIASVESTRKITRAMYLMSASKSKKAKKQMESMLPYFHHSAEVMTEILAASAGQVDTPFLANPGADEGQNLYLVLAADKGMAGGYTGNLLNLLRIHVADKNRSSLWVAGMMGRILIGKQGYQVQPDFKYPVMNPNLYRARDMAELVVEKFLSGEYRRVYLIYTTMVSPLKQEPMQVQLLPLKPEDFLTDGEPAASHDLVDYEPGPEQVFDVLVPHYLKGIIYCALVEAFTSEQNARMFAMDQATKAANDMIEQLTLKYNRERQAGITQEINEIAGGIGLVK